MCVVLVCVVPTLVRARALVCLVLENSFRSLLQQLIGVLLNGGLFQLIELLSSKKIDTCLHNFNHLPFVLDAVLIRFSKPHPVMWWTCRTSDHIHNLILGLHNRDSCVVSNARQTDLIISEMISRYSSEV